MISVFKSMYMEERQGWINVTQVAYWIISKLKKKSFMRTYKMRPYTTQTNQNILDYFPLADADWKYLLIIFLDISVWWKCMAVAPWAQTILSSSVRSYPARLQSQESSPEKRTESRCKWHSFHDYWTISSTSFCIKHIIFYNII